MANQFGFMLGVTPIMVDLKLTIPQIKAIIKRSAQRNAMNIAGLSDVEIANIVLKRMLREMVAESKEVQITESLALQKTTTEAAIAAENDLFDP